MRALSAFLEQGRLHTPETRVGRAIGHAWGRALAKGVVRSIHLPTGLRVVAVGGATFGGSGKTPLAVACARELASESRALRVALVGHAYRATPRHARVVGPEDSIDEVGDEALLAAGALARPARPGGGVAHVVVAPSRQAAIDFASRAADVVVLDGVMQTAPVRASLALLAVDSEEPWGRARAVPPWGDLRAPIASMAEVVDRIVAVGEELGAALPGASFARTVSRGAFVGTDLLSWERLRTLRVGLICALGRPDRVVRSLARRGVTPDFVLQGRDHGPLPRLPLMWGAGRQRARRVDLWLATPKCALHAARLGLSAPLGVLDRDVELGPDVRRALTAVALGNNLETSRNVSQKAAGAPLSHTG